MMIYAAAALLQSDPFLAEVEAQLPKEKKVIIGPGTQALIPSGPEDVITFSRQGQVLQARVAKAGATAYTGQVGSVSNSDPIKEGDTLVAAFEIRSLAGGRETGEAAYSLFAQRSQPDWAGVGFMHGTIGRQWRRLYWSGKSPREYPAGTFQVTFHISQQSQVIEWRNFAVWNLGQNVSPSSLPYNRVSYVGQEPTAPWRKKAAQMIEKNRKAPLTLTVQRKGKPVAGATLEVKLVRHEYPFASFLDRDPTIQDKDGELYRKHFPKLFNQATVPIYWADWGWDSPESRKGYFNRFAWARKEGLTMKAHNLVWPSFLYSPPRLKPLRTDPAAFKKAVMDEAQSRVDQLKSQPFVNIDVLNELRTETEFAEIIGSDAFYKELFLMAKKAWPKAHLVYNDYDIFEGGGLNLGSRTRHKEIVRKLLADGVPLTMIGWQGHFGESVTPPEMVWQLLDEYQKEFGLPLEITEFDVGTRDERSQADYTRDLLTAWFAHPSTAGFTMWGFHEAYHWRPEGALFRRDWTPKPNYHEWVRLTQKEWTTHQKVKTTRKGQASVRGFRGAYEVKVTVGGKTTLHRAALTGSGSRAVISLP